MTRKEKIDAIAIEIAWSVKVLYSSQTKKEWWKSESPNDKHHWRNMAERVLQIAERPCGRGNEQADQILMGR